MVPGVISFNKGCTPRASQPWTGRTRRRSAERGGSCLRLMTRFQASSVPFSTAASRKSCGVAHRPLRGIQDVYFVLPPTSPEEHRVDSSASLGRCEMNAFHPSVIVPLSTHPTARPR